MKQASSVSKVNEQAGKTRKLNSSRNNILQQKQSSKPFMRLKSNHQGEQLQNTTTKLPVKPRSSMSKRPASAYKQSAQSETVNSVATTSSAKSEQEVKEIISTVFSHSKKLHDFLSDKQLDEHQAFDALVNNQLFTLSLVTMVSNKNPQEINKYVERSCIHKLDRIVAMEKQKSICEGLENKIGDLIEKRIKALSHFS